MALLREAKLRGKGCARLNYDVTASLANPGDSYGYKGIAGVSFKW
jgi:hypothetical protein